MRVLDLFCCEGGASKGYEDAGFTPYGIDLFQAHSRKRYPYAAYTGDAIDAMVELISGRALPFAHLDGTVEWLGLEDFDLIHASPPCQKYSITNAARQAEYPDLIEPTRVALRLSGLPYVIENVVGAPLIDPVTLCWTMFHEPGSVLDTDGTPLQMFRHRLFETSFALPSLSCNHDTDVQVAGSYGGARRDKHEARHVRHGGYVPAAEVQQELLGICWATQKGMHQSLPPVYTEYIGRSFRALREEAA